MNFAIGVDIGGSSAKIGAVDASGSVVKRHRVLTPDTNYPVEAVQAYVKGIRQLLDGMTVERGEILGIGIGMPGQIQPDRQSATWSNVPVLDDFPLVPYLSQQFDMAVCLDNDATVAAIAEAYFGSGEEGGRLLVITVGTGIGVGFVVDGRAQRLTRGCMGDAGHIIVDPKGTWQCPLGCWGCLETVATSLALEREAVIRGQEQANSTLNQQKPASGEITAHRVIEAAHAGDALACDLIENVGVWLGLAATSWCHIYGPDRILVGGGVSAAGELLLEPMRSTMKKTGMVSYVDAVVVELASLGNDAGMIGAASLVFYNL